MASDRLMLRLIAFLRAINVGGHNVTMAELRGFFEDLALKEVETFIASGNVIFASSSKDIRALQQKIENQLLRSLGYEVKAFLRTVPEVAAIIGLTRCSFARSNSRSGRATGNCGSQFSLGCARIKRRLRLDASNEWPRNQSGRLPGSGFKIPFRAIVGRLCQTPPGDRSIGVSNLFLKPLLTNICSAS